MRRTALVLLAAAATAGSAQAQVHYSCDPPIGAVQTCRDSKGDRFQVQTDQFGTTVTDNHGNRTRMQDDGMGGTIVQDNNGRRSHIQGDGLGGFTIRGPDGSVAHERTDAFGNTVYRDQQGHQTRCRSAPFVPPGQTEMDCQ